MKPKTVPTSPKHPDNLPNRPGRSWTLVVVLSLVVGLVTSVGAVYGLFWMADRYPQSPWLRPISRRTSDSAVVVRQEVQKSADIVHRIERAVQPSLVSLASRQVDGQYAADQLLGLATAVTSDGWAVTLGREPLDSKIAFVHASEMANVLRASAAALPLSLVRLSIPTTPLAFADSASLDLGMEVWVAKYDGVNGGLHLLAASLVSLSARAETGAAGVESSDQLNRRFELDRPLDDTWIGAAVVDAAGRLVGLADPKSIGGHSVVPVNGLQRRLADLVKSETTERPALGVEYFDLSGAHAIAGAPAKGAKIVAFSKTLAPPAGLKIGDVITGVDGAPLTARRWLSDAIAESAPGRNVRLEILRGSDAISIQVVLGSLPSSE
ncbi:MAG: serine protease [Candidatus Kerfeldbacteria bacterium]|nr:serine protease [Candidatus Kerfeldbacteria bacterium]